MPGTFDFPNPIVDLIVHGARGPGALGASAEHSAVVNRSQARLRSVRHDASEAAARRVRHTRLAIAVMVIVSRKPQGKPNPANAGNPDKISLSATLPAKAGQCVYGGFIAMLKLPFKFDRS
ncbi:MAG: hypothetical protein WCA28_32450 [Bradyrhizobium sp.]